MKIDIEKAKERGWMFSYGRVQDGVRYPPMIGPPFKDERHNWAAEWLKDSEGVQYPHWIDDDLLIK